VGKETMSSFIEKIAIVAITRHGVKLADKLKSLLGRGDLFVSSKFRSEVKEANFFEVSLRELVAGIWPLYDAFVFFVSLGAVIRIIAPHIKDKHVDPAVITIDDNATFVISVLSGHIGGANELTEDIARLLGATPVITTASDVGRTIPVDILGRQFGWMLEGEENTTKVSAAVVNRERVGLFQDAGEKDWWKRETPIPENIKIYDSFDAMVSEECAAYLIITDRVFDESYSSILHKAVLYRPKSLVLGVGCDRGVSADEIEELVVSTLKKNGLSLKSVRSIATIDNRKKEKGINEFAEKYGLPIQYFTRDELNQVKDVPNPSEMAMKYLGVIGVAEPAAILGSRWGELVIPKVKSKMATLAVARIRFKQ
jgi:cobalt-precorrin 5A hydrolase